MQIFIEGKGTTILLGIPRLGYEGAGVVEKTGANVQGISVGDLVVFAYKQEFILKPRKQLIHVIGRFCSTNGLEIVR